MNNLSLQSQVDSKPSEELKTWSIKPKKFWSYFGHNVSVLIALGIVFVFLVSILLTFSYNSTCNHTYNRTKKEILNLVDQHYIGEMPDKQDFFEGELRGLVSALGDPFSSFLNQKDNENFKNNIDKKYEGIGVRLKETELGIIILETLPNSPASESGLLPGDVIIALDGESIQNKTVNEISSKILGEEGTVLQMVVLRSGQEIEFFITRAQITSPLVSLRIEDDIGIITLSSFGSNIDTEMLIVASEIEQNPKIKKLILDLRDNTGGMFSGAVAVSSYFIEPNLTVAIERSKKGEKIDISAQKEVSLKKYPLIILTNQKTASASEIVVAAIKYHRDDVISVGQTTFGKGVVQTIFQLRSGGFLRLTTAEWLSPNGTAINKIGVKPDIEINSQEDTLQIVLNSFDWESKQLVEK